MAEHRPIQLTPQLIIGLMVIGIGVMFALKNFGFVRWDRSVLRYWPAGLIAIGLAKLWQSREGSGGASAASSSPLPA